MPRRRTTRDIYKRKLDQSKGNIQTAQDYLNGFIDVYTPDHPTLGYQAFLIHEGLDEMKEAIDKLNKQV